MDPLRMHALQRALPVPLAGPTAIGGLPSLRLARRALSATFQQLLLWQERATERHHLSMTEEHMLGDVGLRRVDLEPEISKPCWRA